MDQQDDSDASIVLNKLDADLTEELIDSFTRLASGDFKVRLARNYRRDNRDIVAHLFNMISEELGRIVGDSEVARQRLEVGVTELNERFLKVASGDFGVRAPRDESGDPLDVLGFFFDTTVEELDDAFKRERQQQSLLSVIFEATTDGVMLVSSDGYIKLANQSASRLLERGTLVGLRFSELVASRDRSFAMELEGSTSDFSARDTVFDNFKDKPELFVLSGAALQFDGKSDGMVLSLRDDRDVRRAREQLQASDRMATMGTLAAGVAHEINNPMSFVLSNVEYALEELQEIGPERPIPTELYQELMKALDTSRTGCERVNQIVLDLKSISRVDESSLSPVDVHSVLDSSLSMLRHQTRHRARIIKDYATLPPVFVNEARLVQICLNLIQNAAQAIELGSASANEIRLQTRMGEGDELQLSISDTGCGMSADAIESIFQAFYTTKEIGVGTGLGLSICRRLIDSMGGRIEVESEVGLGSTFRVYIPTHPPD